MIDDRTGIAAALVRLARDHDPLAWALLVERCGPASERLARRLIGDAASAQDAVQEAWLQIRDGAKGFTPRGSDPDAGAWGWIMRVTANATAQQLRKRGREPLQALGGIDPPAPAPSESPDPALLAVVRGALTGLPEDQRSAVVLHHVEGLDFAAIGAALGCSPAAAKKRAQRGLERLRRAISLRDAMPALSLLVLTGLLRDLPAAEGAAAGASLSALLSSPTAVPQGTAPASIGMPMAIKLTLFATASLIVFAGGVMLSQESPAPASTLGVAVHVLAVVPVPLPAPDPATMAFLDQVIEVDPARRTTYREHLDDLTNRSRPLLECNFVIGQWASGQWLDRSLTTALTRRQLLSALADQGGAVWRVRGHVCDILPRDVAAALSQPTAGADLPRGGWDAWSPWMSRVCGSPGQPWIGQDLDQSVVFVAQGERALAEEWLAGLAVAGECFLRVGPTGQHGVVAVRRVAQPTFREELRVDPGMLSYNPPPPALLDRELTLNYSERPVADVLADISFRSGIRIEVDHDLRDAPPITLKVSQMKTRFVLDFVTKLAELEEESADGLVRLRAKPKDSSEWHVVAPVDDAAPAHSAPVAPAVPAPSKRAPSAAGRG